VKSRKPEIGSALDKYLESKKEPKIAVVKAVITPVIDALEPIVPQTIKRWSLHSLTVGWGYVKILVGLILISFHELWQMFSDLVTDDGVKIAMDRMNFPAYVGLGLAIIGCLTIASRLRSLKLEGK